MSGKPSGEPIGNNERETGWETMSGKQREDLDWLAFRYVAAELTLAESREFEGRLEHDQEAREAVGRVVEVTCAVRSLDWDVAPHVASVRRRHAWYQRRSVQWIAGLALGVALAVLVWGPPRGDQADRRDGGLVVGLPPGELALVWSKARSELPAPSEREADGLGGWAMTANRRSEAASDDTAAVETPDWMIAAVVAMESEALKRNEPADNVEGT